MVDARQCRGWERQSLNGRFAVVALDPDFLETRFLDCVLVFWRLWELSLGEILLLCR